MSEPEHGLQFRSGTVVQIGRTTVTSAETAELRRLFDQVADTCDAANELLRKAGPPPVGAQLERLREMRARAEAMVERLKMLLE